MNKRNELDRERELIFVYNASSGFFSRLNDFAHKIISPQTYSCHLCQVTHGNTQMHSEWAEYIQSLPYNVRFQYKDQWKTHHKFPLVLLREKGEVKIFVSSEEMILAETIGDLINLLNAKSGLKNKSVD